LLPAREPIGLVDGFGVINILAVGIHEWTNGARVHTGGALAASSEAHTTQNARRSSGYQKVMLQHVSMMLGEGGQGEGGREEGGGRRGLDRK